LLCVLSSGKPEDIKKIARAMTQPDRVACDHRGGIAPYVNQDEG
jgi:hypothetical protein